MSWRSFALKGNYGFDLSRIRSDDDERHEIFAVVSTLTNSGIVADS